MIDKRIAALKAEEATRILRLVARRWIEQPDAEAFIVYQRVKDFSEEDHIVFPEWLDGNAQDPSKNLELVSRAALSAILENKENEAHQWIEEELSDIEKAKAHAFEPVTAAILGATLIGCILAARIQKIGSVTFYEGIPEELSKIIKKYAAIISKGI